MNRVVLVGRLTKDPELRKTKSNKSQVKFTLAVNRKVTNQDGEREADFITCVAWNGTAEAIAKYITKGRELAVEGRIQTGKYEAQDGSTKYTCYVVVNDITFIGNKNNTNASNKEQDIKKDEKVVDDPFADFGTEITDDDLPF